MKPIACKNDPEINPETLEDDEDTFEEVSLEDE